MQHLTTSSPSAAAPVSFFCLVGCRGAQRHEKKENGIGPLLSSRSLHLSHTDSSFVVLALFFSPWLPRRVGLWMLSLSYLMPSTLRRQWRYQHIHSFQILPSPPPLPRDVPPQTPKRAYQWSSRRKRKGKNVGISWILLSLWTNSPGCCTNQILIVHEIWNACLRSIFFDAPFYNTFLIWQSTVATSYFMLQNFSFFFRFDLRRKRRL